MRFVTENILREINSQIGQYQFGKTPPNLYDPISYILELGGKRLRPLMVLLSHYMFSEDIEAAIKPALAVEVFHNFTLMHDDIMDNASLRRGKETVHKKWSSNVAILSGDVMLVKAYDLLLTVDEKYLKKVLLAFNSCAAGVCEGQQLDVDYESRAKVSLDEYFNMITLKTAVLLGFSMELGALLGGGEQRSVKALKEFGTKIGIAFQLKDDLLDVFGDKKKFGKKVGGDILEKKKTILLISALELCKGNDFKILNTYLGENKWTDEEKIDKISSLYRKLEIEKIVEGYIKKYEDQALACLKNVNADLYKKGMLRTFVNQLMMREN